MGTDNKSILFLTLSFVCIWVILDNIYGKKHLDVFLSNVFSFYHADGVQSIKTTFNEDGEVVHNINGEQMTYEDAQKDPDSKKEWFKQEMLNPTSYADKIKQAMKG